jgi:phage replication-related protein YjqB (UPF0714/DUF867 family)
MITNQVLLPTLVHWAQLEDRYRESLYDGASPQSNVRITGNRKGSFIFTAAHAVNHIRERKVKYAERGTGGLAELLAISSGSLSLTVDGPLDYDPNWDHSPEIPFKKSLLSLLTNGKTVIDLHGMKDDYGVDICIGLGTAPSAFAKEVAGNLAASLTNVGFRVSMDWPFDGRRIGTITNFVQEKGFSGFQVEIAARLRYPNVSSQDSNLLVDGFVSAVRDAHKCC